MKFLLMGLLSATALLAQSHAYLFIGPGVVNGGSDSSLALLHLGAGGEAVLAKGVGVGGEVGIIGRTDLGALGAASLNGVYQFQRRGRWVPFATGGYSYFFDFGGGIHLANLGGGVNYWFAEHFGLKFDVRDHFRGGANYLEFRFGATFR